MTFRLPSKCFVVTVAETDGRSCNCDVVLKTFSQIFSKVIKHWFRIFCVCSA
jgi:hypothetical protein